MAYIFEKGVAHRKLQDIGDNHDSWEPRDTLIGKPPELAERLEAYLLGQGPLGQSFSAVMVLPDSH